MNIDDHIKQVLKEGSINIGSYTEKLLIAVFLPIHIRVESDRGYRHLLLKLFAEVTGNSDLASYADTTYKYSLGIFVQDPFDVFLQNKTLKICLVGDYIEIHADQVTMPSRDAIPGPYRMIGRGITFSEAVQDLLVAKPRPETCVYSPLTPS